MKARRFSRVTINQLIRQESSQAPRKITRKQETPQYFHDIDAAILECNNNPNAAYGFTDCDGNFMVPEMYSLLLMGYNFLEEVIGREAL